MITEARAQLRGGDARAALATLDRLQSRSRNGALGQEREILTIQALSALGETEDARRRAQAFVASYPDSPHAAQMRGVARGP
jgi:outer membrane protein assembly factor BamD (BamD/ComL family)